MQLLSLLYNNPNLLELMAEIMGIAPQLADRLNRNPHLLEAVLAPDFFDPIPPAEALEAELQLALRDAQYLLEVLEPRQIGGASCRDRVLQKVEIAVVAVT